MFPKIIMPLQLLFITHTCLCFPTNLSFDGIEGALWMKKFGDVDFRNSLAAVSLYDSVDCLIADICFLIYKI